MAIRLQQIDMPEELKKIMSRQAAAEREKRDHHQGRGRPVSRGEPGRGGGDDGGQPRRDATPHFADG